MTKPSKNPRHFWFCFILTTATLSVYSQTRSFEFTNYDDKEYVSDNKNINTGLTWKNVTRVFTNQHAGNWHPLTGLSHILDSQLFALKAGCHHLTNVLLHIINTLLLFTVLKQLTGAVGKSAFVAALFALHPLHVESVAWVSERKDMLSAFFWFLTIAAYHRYVKNPNPSGYLLTLFIFILAIMSKPMVVTLPFVLLLLDYWPLERMKIKNLRHLIIEKIPFFVLSAVSCVITFFIQRNAGAVREIETIALASRIENALVSYAAYIGKMFCPTHLAVFYPHPENKLQIWPALAAAIFLIAITICFAFFCRRYKYLATGWYWYLGTLVPVIGLVQVGDQAMADRYTYIPLTGLFIILAWGAADLLTEWRNRKIILQFSSLLVLTGFSVCSYIQTAYWRNSISLFEHALDVTKDNYVAHYYLTWPLADMGRTTEVIEHFKETLRIKPNESIVHKNMAMALAKQDNLADAAAHLNEALRLDPNLAEAHSSLGYVLNRMGMFQQAEKHFTKALSLKSNLPATYSNFAYTLVNLGRYDEAINYLKTAVQLEPNSAANYLYLAPVFVSVGKTEEAVECYYKILALDPNQLEPMNDLAWLLATHKETKYYNPHQAVLLAEKACKIVKSQNAALLDTLAAAYAADGKFAQAVFTAEQALRLAESSLQQAKSLEIRNRISLYKQAKPYVEPEQK